MSELDCGGCAARNEEIGILQADLAAAKAEIIKWQDAFYAQLLAKDKEIERLKAEISQPSEEKNDAIEALESNLMSAQKEIESQTARGDAAILEVGRLKIENERLTAKLQHADKLNNSLILKEIEVKLSDNAKSFSLVPVTMVQSPKTFAEQE